MSQIPVPAGLIEDTLDHTIEILAKQFEPDAFQRYILLDEMQGSGKTDIGEEMNKEVFAFIVPDFIKAGARCMTVPGSGVASVWTLEEVTENYTEEPHNPPAVTELNSLAHHIRKRFIPPQTTHMLHLVLLANDRTHPSTSNPAKVSDLIRPVLDMAREKGWPVVLESTSPRSRDVYTHLGFQLLEEIVVGKGKVDGEGRGLEGGEGVKLWAMMKC
ncbi:uncharacterized protein J4E79_008318 [Alternaria viburni]|uniref:uncharacterized protein n=1 Tax=Alternaria viburni TaxID=566460 RepID=UPI0020C59982|nr:uncharacterized protein J4E79_008318 [Alternaria viburni]KAI4655252.1 hypothetical protein J4E79_008318 [Alternaria viburni]